MKRWPLFLIALGTFVAIWTGWVQLGAVTGFGWMHPLPGIIPGLRMNAVITLPVSVEAYGAYALGVWLAGSRVPDQARKFAKWSAIGALALGWVGQAASHVLTAAHVTVAPWPVTVIVASVPVVAFGLAVALTHLLRSERKPELVTAPGPAAFPASRTSPPAAPTDRQPQAGTPARKPARKAVKVADADLVAAIRAMPEFPALKPTQVRDALHVRYDTAKELLATAKMNGHARAVGSDHE